MKRLFSFAQISKYMRTDLHELRRVVAKFKAETLKTEQAKKETIKASFMPNLPEGLDDSQNSTSNSDNNT